MVRRSINRRDSEMNKQINKYQSRKGSVALWHSLCTLLLRRETAGEWDGTKEQKEDFIPKWVIIHHVKTRLVHYFKNKTKQKTGCQIVIYDTEANISLKSETEQTSRDGNSFIKRSSTFWNVTLHTFKHTHKHTETHTFTSAAGSIYESIAVLFMFHCPSFCSKFHLTCITPFPHMTTCCSHCYYSFLSCLWCCFTLIFSKLVTIYCIHRCFPCFSTKFLK